MWKQAPLCKEYKDVIAKGLATLSEIIIMCLFGDKDLAVVDRRKKVDATLDRARKAEEAWGPVRSLMHPKIVQEAGSLILSPGA